jgi:hypothetical protein
MNETDIPDVSVEEARVFARRHRLEWMEEAHLQALAKAMTTINAAGRTVPRVAAKMVQPAPVFRIAGKFPRT